MAEQEFKFPDEAENTEVETKEPEDKAVPEAEEKYEIELVDDTPEQDRGRKPAPKEVVDELEQDDLSEYSEKVKKRLSQMKRVWHDERRAKEAVAREREEALRIANTYLDENKRLKSRINDGTKIYFDEVSNSAKTAVEAAKSKIKTAYESGDADAIVSAQEELADAKIRLMRAQDRATPLQTERYEVQTLPEQVEVSQEPVSQPDPKAQAWREKNSWFGSDPEMTASVLGLHEKLVRSGVDPKSNDYYRQLDETMRRRFSEYFEDDSEPSAQEKPAARKSSNVVAPATRSTTPRKIRLTPTQAAMIKKLGITPEAYVKEVLKSEASNG